jgi:thioredoxin-related protein
MSKLNKNEVVSSMLVIIRAKKVTTFFCLLVLSIIALATNISYAGESKNSKTDYVYTPVENPLTLAETVLQRANKQDKYALIVLGAQWCHDSVALAQNFSTEKMQEVLSERFVTKFIDVGYFEDRRDVTKLAGYPNYFATPTVLIIDPKTGQLLNIDTLTTWQSAASVDFVDYVSHFSSWKTRGSDTRTTFSIKTIELDEFEKHQSMRLQNGYAVLGPLLEASEAENRNEQTAQQREQFLDLWKEVKTFRTNVQADIHDMRAGELDSKALAAKLVSAIPSRQSWE